MTIEIYSGDLEDLEADLLICILDANQELFEFEHTEMNEKLSHIKSGFANGKMMREVSFDPAGLKVQSVVVYSTELEKAFSLWENLKTFVTRGLKLGAETMRPRVVVALNHLSSLELIGKAAEGALLGCYSFEKYRKEPKRLFDNVQLVLWTPGGEGEQEQLAYARTMADATNMARDLVHEPASVVTPAALVRKAQELQEQYHLKLDVWDPDRLLQDKCVGLLAVGGGSKHPPHMVSLTYEPETPSDVHLVLLGKGVTFDTGGISIKPAEKMYSMRGDMAGAAAVLGAMQAIAVLKPNLKVTSLVVTCENSPDGNAFRPGDILVYRNGKSVHVDNTDAEGRLILADGLIQAGLLGATHIVDVATLTGAATRALGYSFTGIMGNNRSLINAITRAGGNVGESYWKLPLPAEYKEQLRTPFADLNNMGGPAAGASTAGLFLQEFVPANTAWVHLDIAPTFWREKPWKYYAEGPTGVAVRTLADLAQNWKEHLQR